MAPSGTGRGCAATRDAGCRANGFHEHRRVVDEASAPVWRGGCDQGWARGSRGKRWARRERWTRGSWAGIASRCAGGTGRRLRANGTGSWTASMRTAPVVAAFGSGRSMDDGGGDGDNDGAVTGAGARVGRLVPPAMPPTPAG